MSILNHKEALELAHYQKENSNLSRCYIDLTEQLATSQATTNLWKSKCERQVEHLAKYSIAVMHAREALREAMYSNSTDTAKEKATKAFLFLDEANL